ncbi:uncharacterized protein [Nicotiana sylvestris]|uniref:uncharacterized protein n=1 Tax=Nicotiana sylvestris TaxID=4096 RepID=UPI00388CDF87
MPPLQIHAAMIKVPPNELNATSSPWPFAAWGMDVIGPIESSASNGHRFILVAIDYFTKLVQAASYRAVTKKAVADFVRDRIIRHKNSTVYRSQMNGAVEATNKNIKKIFRKMIEKHKKWHEKLSFALLGYRTTVRTSTGATLYMLVCDIEAVIPAESLQQKSKAKTVHIGQLVLKNIFLHQDEAKGKFSLNWQGPYMVHRVLTRGALILTEMDGEVWPKAINADAVKRYYV